MSIYLSQRCFKDLFAKWGLNADQIIGIDEDLVNDPVKAAEKYEAKLVAIYGGFPVLDFVILGMGPDGRFTSIVCQ